MIGCDIDGVLTTGFRPEETHFIGARLMFIKIGNRVISTSRIDHVNLDHNGAATVYVRGEYLAFEGDEADRLRALFGGGRIDDDADPDWWDSTLAVLDLMAAEIMVPDTDPSPESLDVRR